MGPTTLTSGSLILQARHLQSPSLGKANNVNYNLGGTVEFQLQESDDGTTYTDVAGATASATGTGQQTVTFDDISKTVGAEVEDQFYYRVKVTDTETDQEVVSSDRTTGFTVGPAVVKYETDYTAPTVSGETMTRSGSAGQRETNNSREVGHLDSNLSVGPIRTSPNVNPTDARFYRTLNDGSPTTVATDTTASVSGNTFTFSSGTVDASVNPSYSASNYYKYKKWYDVLDEFKDTSCFSCHRQ